MKKFYIITVVLLVALVSAFACEKLSAMPNPWVDCGADFECANKTSGITFPLRLSNYWIRAMEGMIEIGYPFDEFRSVTVRKSLKSESGDISGVYTKYPINRKMKISNSVEVDIRGTLTKIYVMNFVAESGYYSAYCEQGMNKKEAEGVFEVIREAEESKLVIEAVDNKYTMCELGDLVGKDVKRIKYHNYNIDYHKNDFNKKQILKLADECLVDGISNQYQMDCCMTLKMYPTK